MWLDYFDKGFHGAAGSELTAITSARQSLMLNSLSDASQRFLAAIKAGSALITSFSASVSLEVILSLPISAMLLVAFSVMDFAQSVGVEAAVVDILGIYKLGLMVPKMNV